MKILSKKGEEAFDPSKVTEKINRLSKGLNVDPDMISKEVINDIIDGITTKKIDKISAATAVKYVTNHHHYSELAARIIVDRLHNDLPDNYYTRLEALVKVGYVNASAYEKARKFNVGDMINPSRDFNFDYFGINTMINSRLLRIKKEVAEKHNVPSGIIESPQDLYMRIALMLGDTEEEVKDKYDNLSLKLNSFGSPFMFNSSTKNNTIISCNLFTSIGEDPDSIEGQHETFYAINKHSSKAAGIGYDISMNRSKESLIESTGGHAGGLLRYAKMMDQMCMYYDQSGKRRGSYAIYTPTWHLDIEDMIRAMQKSGDERLLCKNLFFAMWIDDVFMEALEKGDPYYLFCPHAIKKAGLKDFSSIYGEEFKEEYFKAVDMFKAGQIHGKEVSPQKMMFSIGKNNIETGLPYMLYKDNVNRKSMHSNIGTIRSSNLCTEIVQYTNPDVIANCDLGALILPNLIDNGKINHELLEKAVRSTVRSLDKAIDLNDYPTKESRNGGFSQRAIGIGVIGLADVFGKMRIPFDSDKAKQLNKEIFETIYYYALKASIELAKELGPYPLYKGSKYDQGILHHMQYDVDTIYDYTEILKDLKKYGIRNSMLLAPMPTASTSQIAGFSECFEPYKEMIFTRRVDKGDYVIVNKFMQEDMIAMGLNPADYVLQIAEDGGVQNLELPIPDKSAEYFKQRYRTAFQMSNKDIIDMAADRQPFICQSQSLNLFKPTSQNPIGSVISMHRYAWKKGLKTGMYYLRGTGASKGGTNSTKRKEIENCENCEV